MSVNIEKYDVVVIGAGNGGLIAACTCANKGLKTLLIEQHNIPGGFASSFTRGRFEFDPALHELGNVGTKDNQGRVYKIFNELGIKVNWVEVPEAFNLVLDGKQYVLPFGVEEFAKKCDEYCPNSYKKVIKFLEICKDCNNAVIYINEMRGNPDVKHLKKNFPNYLTTNPYTLHEVLKKMRMPKLIKYIIESYWTYLGTSPKEVSASLYGIMFYEYIKYGAYIPRDRSNEISQAIATRFEALGGKIYFNTKAEEIDIKDNKVIGVKTSRGYIHTNHVISNASPHIVFSKMIKQNNVPTLNKQLANTRTPGSQGYSIYLGLNIDIKKLGLKDYSYFVFDSFDHDEIAKKMKSIDDNLNYIVVALNAANHDASPKGTCIITFTTLYDDAWNDVKVKDYFKIKNSIARKIIEDFEQKMNIKIMPYIEEIEIATPETFARYTSSVNGSIYGYANLVTDSGFIRGRNLKEYEIIDGLVFCGGNGFSCHGYSVTYLSGQVAGNRTYGMINAARGKNNG